MQIAKTILRYETKVANSLLRYDTMVNFQSLLNGLVVQNKSFFFFF